MFILQRAVHGPLSLRFRGMAIPANEAYLERLLQEKGIPLTAGGEMSVDGAFAIDAIEEALAATGRDIVSAQARKLALLRGFEIATSTATERSKAVA